jgi:hypothetical protein
MAMVRNSEVMLGQTLNHSVQKPVNYIILALSLKIKLRIVKSSFSVCQSVFPQ